MYLARHEHGKPVVIYNVDSFWILRDKVGREVKRIAREEKAWTFEPKLGHEGHDRRSTLCECGVAVMALSEDRALSILAEFEAHANRQFN